MHITNSLPGRRSRTRMPNMKRYAWIALPLIVVVAIALVIRQTTANSTSTTATTTATVAQGDMTISVSASGTLQAANTQALPFQIEGRIKTLNVKVGDRITKSQVLATLDDSDVQVALQQAEANLASAEAKQKETLEGTTTASDVAVAKASLTSAQANLEKTRTGGYTAADIQSAQAQVLAAQAKLNDLNTPSTATQSAAQLKLSQAQADFEKTRDSLSQAKTDAYNAMQEQVNNLSKVQRAYSTAKDNWEYVKNTGKDPINPTTTDSSGNSKSNKLSEKEKQEYYYAFLDAEVALKNAQQSVSDAQTVFDTARQNEATQVPLAAQELKDTQTQIADSLTPAEDEIASAQAAVVAAQANLDKIKQGGTKAELASAQANVIQSQASLEKLNEPATDAETASAYASVLQAKAQLKSAKRDITNTTLIAPFDGVVSNVAVTTGSNVSGSTTVLTVVDDTQLHVDLSLSESDVAKVKIGQPVKLTFDAVSGTVISGTIDYIAPVATVSQNVVTYVVRVTCDTKGTPVRVGMSASAEIQIQQIKNAILVPSRAVQTSGTTKTVTVLYGADRKPVTVQVTTGQTSNGQVEILECVETSNQCLKAGDTLSVGGTTTTSGSSTTTQRGGNVLSGGPGGFGR